MTTLTTDYDLSVVSLQSTVEPHSNSEYLNSSDYSIHWY